MVCVRQGMRQAQVPDWPASFPVSDVHAQGPMPPFRLRLAHGPNAPATRTPSAVRTSMVASKHVSSWPCATAHTMVTGRPCQWCVVRESSEGCHRGIQLGCMTLGGAQESLPQEQDTLCWGKTLC